MGIKKKYIHKRTYCIDVHISTKGPFDPHTAVLKGPVTPTLQY